MLFKRDPAVLLAVFGAAIKLIAAFLIHLTVDEQAVLNALVAAVVGFAVAAAVRHDGQVPALLGVLQAMVAVAVGFGLRLSAEEQAIIMSFAAAVASMWVRTQVTAAVGPVPAAVRRE